MVDFKALATQAAKKTSHAKTVVHTDYEKPLAAAGKAPARFIEYIELGVQPQRAMKGVEQPPKPMARFTFELLGKKNIHEVTANGETKKFADRISLEFKISMNEKAGFKKLFEKMRQGRDGIEHFGQMLNDAFMVTVVHNTVGEGDTKKTYANIHAGTEFYIESTKQEILLKDEDGELTGETEIVNVSVKPAMSDIKIFLMDNPNKETWASLAIAGTRKVKQADGTEKEVSKNWLQERILKSVNFSGSLLEEMLSGSAPDALEESDDEDEPEQEPVSEPKKEQAAKKSVKTVATKQTQKAPASVASTTKSPSKNKAKVTDSLASLGIA